MAVKKTTIAANPTAPEIYADRASSVTLRGNVARMTFASERVVEDPAASQPVVAGHVAMSVRGFLQLYSQMQSVVRQMEEAGLVKRAEPAEKPKTTARKTRRKSTASAKK